LNKIINYKNPGSEKYFLYPHLLVLPGNNSQYYYPLLFLDSVRRRDLSDFIDIKNTFSLEIYQEETNQ